MNVTNRSRGVQPSFVAALRQIFLGVAFAATGLAAEGSATPIVRVQSASNSPQVKVQETVEFSLQVAGLRDWADANLGVSVVRTVGKQESLAPRITEGRVAMIHTFSDPGWALVAISVGPTSTRGKSDSWQRVTHCSKQILQVKDANGAVAAASRSADPGIMAKVGQRFEIVPLVPATAMRSEGDLPFRVYADFEKAVDVPVLAIRPDGTSIAAMTDAVGSAHVRLNQAGRWIIRYETTRDNLPCLAELMFEVPSQEAQQSNP